MVLAACLVMAAAMVLTGSMLAPRQAYANSEDGMISRSIAIAYDNSGSMVYKSTKWCTAKYSLEVLAAMLDESDTMSLFVMDSHSASDGGDGSKHVIDLTGSQPITDRVSAIHEADLDVSDETGPQAAKDALAYLQSQSAADERYLIITTDGEFTVGDRFKGIEETVAAAKKDGIKVIYLAIGAQAGGSGYAIDADPAHDVYVKLASSSESILSTMVDIANQVFGRDALPASSVDKGSGKLSFDVPMSQLVVFAQGEDIKIGDLTTQDGQTIAGEMANVRYADYATHLNTRYGEGEPNRELQGVVCAFKGQIPKGEAQVSVEGAKNIEVYYTPLVGIAVDLVDDATSISYQLKPGEVTELSAGTYKPSFRFVDPTSNTGEAIFSDLLKNPSFSLLAEQGGNVQEVGQGEPLNIEPGEVNLFATAVTNGTVRVSQDYRGINVSPAVTPMLMDANAIPSSLPIVDFDKQRYDVKISKADGTAFTPEEWDNLEFSIEDTSTVAWDIQKSEQPGVVSVAPQWFDNDAWATSKRLLGLLPVEAKDANLHITAQIVSGSTAYRANDDRTISYTGDWLNFFMHTWPFLLALLILLYLIYKYLTKPRLPRKIRPHVVIASQDEPVALSYNEANIQNKLSPWGPETITFNARTPKDPTDAQNLRLTERYELSRIGLVACKKEGNKRRFKFDEQTISDMRRHISAAQEREESREQGFPDPDYSPKPAKSFKEQASRGIGSTLTFVGYNIPPRGKKKQEETYTLYFKKPQ